MHIHSSLFLLTFTERFSICLIHDLLLLLTLLTLPMGGVWNVLDYEVGRFLLPDDSNLGSPWVITSSPLLWTSCLLEPVCDK